MAIYSIEILPTALRDLGKIEKTNRERIRRSIEALAIDPHPPGAKLLQGKYRHYRRIRVGSYRVIYSIEKGRLVILVVKIGQRDQVYR